MTWCQQLETRITFFFSLTKMHRISRCACNLYWINARSATLIFGLILFLLKISFGIWAPFRPYVNEPFQVKIQKRIFNLVFSEFSCLQVNDYEIVLNFFHISHNLTWYSAIVHKFTRIYPVCSTYELTKQFM